MLALQPQVLGDRTLTGIVGGRKKVYKTNGILTVLSSGDGSVFSSAPPPPSSLPSSLPPSLLPPFLPSTLGSSTREPGPFCPFVPLSLDELKKHSFSPAALQIKRNIFACGAPRAFYCIFGHFISRPWKIPKMEKKLTGIFGKK